jgi:hypothetical protein
VIVVLAFTVSAVTTPVITASRVIALSLWSLTDFG